MIAAAATRLKPIEPALSARAYTTACDEWIDALGSEPSAGENIGAMFARMFAAALENEYRSPHERMLAETATALASWCTGQPSSTDDLTALQHQIAAQPDQDLRTTLMAPVATAWLHLRDLDRAQAAANLSSITALHRSGYLTGLRDVPGLRDHVIALITREQGDHPDTALEDLLAAWFTYHLADGDTQCLVARIEQWLSRGDSMEPITLAVASAVVVTEGIKFLYGQAGELLRRRRERKNQTEPQPVTLASPPPGVFEGTVQPTEADFEVVEKVKGELAALWQALAPYANELEDVDPNDASLVETADAMRKLLEATYGQRLTFKGEPREASGPMVLGRVEIDTIAGEVAGVRARNIRGGQITGEITGKELKPGATAAAVEAKGDIG